MYDRKGSQLIPRTEYVRRPSDSRTCVAGWGITGEEEEEEGRGGYARTLHVTPSPSSSLTPGLRTWAPESPGPQAEHRTIRNRLHSGARGNSDTTSTTPAPTARC